MWIRSQDKTRLLKANYVRKNGSFIEAVHSDGSCTLIGKYSIEEKALKVLDTIQETINQQEEFKAQGEERRGTSYRRMIEFVFQMPQDSEV